MNTNGLTIYHVGVGAFVLVMLVCVALIFTLPGHIAKTRRHPNAAAIIACQWVGLILWPAWFVALIWAFTSGGAEPQQSHGFPVASRAPDPRSNDWPEIQS